MKLIIDAPDEIVKKGFEGPLTDEERQILIRAIGNGISYEEPQGEREFIEILAQNVPDNICTYPEYRGKPYYSIHYKENGEEFVGFGTYNPEVLSRYLRDYFIKGGAV